MTKKGSNKKFVIGMAVAFLLPLSFYLIAKLLKKDQIHMPGYFRTERVDTSMAGNKKHRDTVYHSVADLVLYNQFGEHVSVNENLKGKILVVNFFFTNCPTVCRQLTNNIKMIQNAFRKDPKKEFRIGDGIQFLSITVDPERDSFQALRAYADQHNVDQDRWWFLTGNKKLIYHFARKELGVSVQTGDGGVEDFIHTEKLVLLDKDRYIRGYYDGLDTADIRRCADDIVLLTLEKKGTK